MQPKEQTPPHLPCNDTNRCVPYLVVVADMAFSDRHEHIESYHLVLTSAEDGEAAREQSRNARPPGGGYAPLAAFCAEDLQDFLNLLADHPLAPGESFNLMTDLTDREATAERLTEGES